MGKGKLEINSKTPNFDYVIPNELFNFYFETTTEQKLFEQLNQEGIKVLKAILKHNHDILYREGENLTCTTKTKHSIVTKTNRLVYLKITHFPFTHEQEVEK